MDHNFYRYARSIAPMSARTCQRAARSTLLAAARKAVEKHGYAGLTLERIAAEADISRVTLHRRGHSKDEIFNALITQMFEEHRDALWPALVAGGNGAERLGLAVAKDCDLCERDLPLMLAARAQLDEAVHGEDGPIDQQPAWLVAEPFQVLARDGIADGSLRDGDPEVFGALMANWAGDDLRQPAHHLRLEPAPRPQRVVDQVAVAFAA